MNNKIYLLPFENLFWSIRKICFDQYLIPLQSIRFLSYSNIWLVASSISLAIVPLLPQIPILVFIIRQILIYRTISFYYSTNNHYKTIYFQK